MKNFNRKIILWFAIIFLLPGCATTPNIIKSEDVQGIKKMAVVTYLTQEDLKILNRSPHNSSMYVGSMGALGVIILESIAISQFKSSLGGNPDLLKEETKNLPIKKVFDEYFIKGFSADKFKVVSPYEVNSLDINEYSEKESANGKTIKDYIALYKQLDVDTVLEIQYIYGLAVYSGVRPSAVISANISVINIPENKLLMKKEISSDSFYSKRYTVDEFRANDAELFKKEIVEAIQGFAHLVAKEFGIELSLKKKSYWQTEK